MAEEKTQNVDEMIENITKQLEELREELMEIEKNFNMKKEQFLKLQGALEAFQAVKMGNL
jgi:archaellum component FlaC